MRKAALLMPFATLMLLGCGGSDTTGNDAAALENAADQSDPAAAAVLENAADNIQGDDPAAAQQALQDAGNAQAEADNGTANAQ